ncbi:MAG: hypothetical protein ABI151_04050 [Chitinophagaceae bacterium]
MRKLFCWLIILTFFSAGHAQEVHRLLTDLKSFQNKEGDNRGLFPSFRQYEYRKSVLKPDDNIFFTALIAWTLRDNLSQLDSIDKKIALSIINEASKVYPNFQNAKGRPTYNYWKTKPPEVFPNGGLINLLNKKQALPDDLDCTAITMMAMNASVETVDSVHRLMQGFTNEGGRAKAMLSRYKYFETYSTWFGRKMPVDLDVCVLSNILVMVNRYQFNYHAADSAALDFIRLVVEKKDYLDNAGLISGYYQRSPVILYHLSRLMQGKNYPALETYRKQLVEDALTLYNRSGRFMDKVLLSTSLMRWGARPPVDSTITTKSFEEVVSDDHFVFFIANMGVIAGYPYNKWLSRSGVGRFNYYCPAYNYALLLENDLLWKKLFP